MSVFEIAASAMNAQMLRLNTTASNLANVETVSGTADGAYRAKSPVFQAMMMQAQSPESVGVRVNEVQESNAETPKRYQPSNPLADQDGYVYASNVNAVEEMANMISASRAYQSNAEIFSTAKTLMLRTLQLGQN